MPGHDTRTGARNVARQLIQPRCQLTSSTVLALR